LVNLAIELGQEGREGAPVAPFLLLETRRKVLELSKPMIFNPFLGLQKKRREMFLIRKSRKALKSLLQLTVLFNKQ